MTRAGTLPYNHQKTGVRTRTEKRERAPGSLRLFRLNHKDDRKEGPHDEDLYQKLADLSVKLAELSKKTATAAEDAKVGRELLKEAIREKMVDAKGAAANLEEDIRNAVPTGTFVRKLMVAWLSW